MKHVRIVCMILVVLMALGLCACATESQIELSVKNVNGATYEVAPGGTLQFETKLQNVDEKSVEYVVTAGKAKISSTGLLTADTDAEVGSTITVVAQSGKVKSNSIQVNVVDLKPTAIDLVASKTKIAIGGSVTFSVEYTPAHATVKDYTLSVTKGADYVTLDAATKTLTVKDDVDVAALTDNKVTVTAVLTSDATIKDEVTIEIVESNIFEIIAATKTFIFGSANQYIEPIAYNEAGDELLDVDKSEYTYETSDSKIATVVQADGRIVPNGHGSAIITIKAPNGVEGQCKVNIIIPPESMIMDNMDAKIISGSEFSYSKVDALDLGIAMVRTNYTCTQKVKYTFELIDEATFDVIASGDDVATVSDDGIEFKMQGKVRVGVSSDSSLEGVTANLQNFEKTISLTINVNEGVNVNSIADLVAYANESNAGKVCNILRDLYLTEDDNFGYVYAEGSTTIKDRHATLTFYGDRIINGNGFIISTQRLDLVEENKQSSGGTFMEFLPAESNPQPFKVQIYDFEFIGSSSVSGKYNGERSEYADKDTTVMNGTKKMVYSTYAYGLRIGAGNEENKNYVKDLIVSNVKISGFGCGMRINHSVNGFVTNTQIKDCFSNGIESSQNIIEFNNMTIGQVGAFAIEVAPDSMADQDTALPKGTAGINYDETPEIKMTGRIDCTNFNNGSATEYLKTYNGGIFSQLSTIVTGLLLRDVQTTDVSDPIVQKTANCIYKDFAKGDLSVNLYLFIFVDPEDYINYHKGNTENVFTRYASDEANGNLITLSNLIANFKADANYTGYKNYKYIQIDLDLTGLMPGMGNIGQVIVANGSYEA